MTIRDEIKWRLAQAGLTQYKFCKDNGIYRTNFAAYLRGKDTLSAKKLDSILDALRRATPSTTLGDCSDILFPEMQQNYMPISNIAEKQIFINKADNNQRLHIEYSKPYLSATISDLSEGKAFILLNLDVKVKDNPETKLRELSDFIQKQFPTAQWQLLNYPDQSSEQ